MPHDSDSIWDITGPRKPMKSQCVDGGMAIYIQREDEDHWRTIDQISKFLDDMKTRLLFHKLTLNNNGWLLFGEMLTEQNYYYFCTIPTNCWNIGINIGNWGGGDFKIPLKRSFPHSYSGIITVSTRLGCRRIKDTEPIMLWIEVCLVSISSWFDAHGWKWSALPPDMEPYCTGSPNPGPYPHPPRYMGLHCRGTPPQDMGPH